jgi:tight adherence protein C
MTNLPISPSALVFLGVVFLAVMLVAFVAGTLLRPRPVHERLQALQDGPARDAAPQTPHPWISRWLASFASVSAPSGIDDITPARLRLQQAGLRSRAAPMVFYGLKTACTFLFPAILVLYAGVSQVTHASWILLAALVLSAGLGFYLPDFVVRRMAAARRLELFFAFPDALDVMRICVEAGLSLDAAIQRVSREIRIECPALSDELHEVSLELRAGASRRQALHNLGTRVRLEDVDALVSMLVQADRFGTSIADALRVHSRSLRTRRRMAAEERAAKLPVKLLMPLVLLIFPALLTVLLGPAFISIYRVLLPTMAR